MNEKEILERGSKRGMFVVFLDIDGVVTAFNPTLMSNLKRIMDTTGAHIVLSSSWRHSSFGRAEVNKQLRKYGIPEFFSVTPKLGGGAKRVHEILAWVHQQNTKNNLKKKIIKNKSEDEHQRPPQFEERREILLERKRGKEVVAPPPIRMGSIERKEDSIRASAVQVQKDVMDAKVEALHSTRREIEDDDDDGQKAKIVNFVALDDLDLLNQLSFAAIHNNGCASHEDPTNDRGFAKHFVHMHPASVGLSEEKAKQVIELLLDERNFL